jgi:transposase
MKRAQVLLLAHEGKADEEIVSVLKSSTSTVYRTRRRFVEGGLEFALEEARREGGRRKLSPRDEAVLVALACSEAPDGRSRWTYQMLADQLVVMTEHQSISAETVRRRLLEQEIKPWQRQMWSIGKVDAEFIARMEDLLDLYAEPHDPRRPIVCFDETLKQLVADVTPSLQRRRGRPERYDHHYARNGTAYLHVALDPHLRKRWVFVTENRSTADFAKAVRDIVDSYPEAEKIRLVVDNLNIHGVASLYKAFGPEEARRIARRLELHFTPVHGSWLNLAELEISVLARQCLGRRIASQAEMNSEVAAWTQRRNNEGGTIRWLFGVNQARTRFHRFYQSLSL